MSKVVLSSPWVLYFRKIEALFQEDPDIKVQLVDEDYTIKIYVESAVKAEALAKLLPSQKVFGNVTVTIQVIPADVDCLDKVALIKKAFDGNKALSKIDTTTLFGQDIAYVLFKKEVVQYYSDDISDAHGLTSTLYQDLAKDVLGVSDSVYFCTDTE